MSLRDQLLAETVSMQSLNWTGVDARVIPMPADIQLGQHYKYLDRAAVLYADLDGSTDMVDFYRWEFSASIYKSFLNAVARIVKANGGTITAYDGDRLMAIFIGQNDCKSAVSAAFEINYAVKEIIQPAVQAVWTPPFSVLHTTGIDVSPLRAVRTGVRGDNDIVWVGRAANHAAKLTAQSSSTPTWISAEVYDSLPWFLRSKGLHSMWSRSIAHGRTVYSSDWLRRFD